MLDAVAEVTNMIIGNVKTVLESRLGAMGLSTPTVIYGRNFQTAQLRQPGMDCGAVHRWIEDRMCMPSMHGARIPRRQEDHAQAGISDSARLLHS